MIRSPAFGRTDALKKVVETIDNENYRRASAVNAKIKHNRRKRDK